MAKTQFLRRRIRSITNTKQITKAMEIVASVKMRHAQERVLRARPYATATHEAIHQSGLVAASQLSHPLLQSRPIKNRLLIIITSDRGLAGAYNSNVLRLFLASLKQATENQVGIKAIVIGNYGIQFARRLDTIELIGVYPHWPTESSYTDIRPIARTAMDEYKRGSVDSVEIIYTKFTSTIKQHVLLAPIIPMSRDTESDKQSDTIVYEPSSEVVLSFVIPRAVEVAIYQAVLDAVASEESMRMMAMKNASDNAAELIDDLTLTYNSARQAAITQELAEITSGAEAMR